jgi:hypothetical protein
MRRRNSQTVGMPQLVRLAHAGLSETLPNHVRFGAASLDGLAAILAERFVGTGFPDREAVFPAFAQDHAIDPA